MNESNNEQTSIVNSYVTAFLYVMVVAVIVLLAINIPEVSCIAGLSF